MRLCYLVFVPIYTWILPKISQTKHFLKAISMAEIIWWIFFWSWFDSNDHCYVGDHTWMYIEPQEIENYQDELSVSDWVNSLSIEVLTHLKKNWPKEIWVKNLDRKQSGLKKFWLQIFFWFNKNLAIVIILIISRMNSPSWCPCVSPTSLLCVTISRVPVLGARETLLIRTWPTRFLLWR